MSCERITPELPRAPSSAARATESTISSRPISSIGARVGEPVELVEHRAQRERHVVPRVAVGDREDVEVVDLLAAGLELGQRAPDDGPEAEETGVGHAGGRSGPLGDQHAARRSRRASSSSSLGDLAGLQAAGADVHPSRRTVDERPHLLEVRVEAALRRHHRVGAALAEGGALAAGVTDACHGAGSIAADRRWVRWGAWHTRPLASPCPRATGSCDMSRTAAWRASGRRTTRCSTAPSRSRSWAPTSARTSARGGASSARRAPPRGCLASPRGHDLRRRRARRALVHRDGAPARRHRGRPAARRRARSSPASRCAGCTRRPTRSTRRTSSGSSTATSSRPTCCSTSATGSRWPTSASPGSGSRTRSPRPARCSARPPTSRRSRRWASAARPPRTATRSPSSPSSCSPGEKPFRAENFAAQARAHVDDAAAAPRPSATPSCRAAVDRVLARGMAKAPGDRSPSAGAFVEALEDALAERGEEPTMVAEPTRPLPPTAATRRVAPLDEEDREEPARGRAAPAAAGALAAEGDRAPSAAANRRAASAPPAAPPPRGGGVGIAPPPARRGRAAVVLAALVAAVLGVVAAVALLGGGGGGNDNGGGNDAQRTANSTPTATATPDANEHARAHRDGHADADADADGDADPDAHADRDSHPDADADAHADRAAAVGRRHGEQPGDAAGARLHAQQRRPLPGGAARRAARRPAVPGLHAGQPVRVRAVRVRPLVAPHRRRPAGRLGARGAAPALPGRPALDGPGRAPPRAARPERRLIAARR